MSSYAAPDWVKDAIFYQIFPDRFANGDPSNDPQGSVPWGSTPDLHNFFGGDLQGIIDRFPYLEELGVNALYLTPIFKARSNHKYDTSDYLQVDPAFGTQDLLRKLVDAAHQRGMRVILDAVFNHCGDSFWAFEDLLRNGQASPYLDWFYPNAFPVSQNPANYQTCGGAAFLPKLNLSNPEVREHLLKVAVYWLQETGMDGWRLDVPWKSPMDFWRQFRQVVKTTNPEAYIVAETWRDTAHWLTGDTCDGVMNYPLRDYLLDYCTRDTMDAEDVDYFIHRSLEIHGPAATNLLNLLGSHDTPRLLTLCNGDVARAILAVTMQFTTVGAPMIYYGDEAGLEGGNDPDCRRCMVWDSQAWNRRLNQAYRCLIHARRDHPALRSGDYQTLLVFNGVYAYRRACQDDQVVVVVNPRQARHSLNIPLPPEEAHFPAWRDLFTGKIVTANQAGLHIEELAAKDTLVLIPDHGQSSGRRNG